MTVRRLMVVLAGSLMLVPLALAQDHAAARGGGGGSAQEASSSGGGGGGGSAQAASSSGGGAPCSRRDRAGLAAPRRPTIPAPGATRQSRSRWPGITPCHAAGAGARHTPKAGPRAPAALSRTPRADRRAARRIAAPAPAAIPGPALRRSVAILGPAPGLAATAATTGMVATTPTATATTTPAGAGGATGGPTVPTTTAGTAGATGAIRTAAGPRPTPTCVVTSGPSASWSTLPRRGCTWTGTTPAPSTTSTASSSV